MDRVRIVQRSPRLCRAGENGGGWAQSSGKKRTAGQCVDRDGRFRFGRLRLCKTVRQARYARPAEF